jgi:hypothetical protein
MRWVRVAVGAVVATTAVAGCGATEPTTAETAAADTAETVCTVLRRWDNELSEAINAASQSITDDDDPTTANAVLLDGFDEAIALAEDHRAELDELRLPAGRDRERLLDELRSGADEAIVGLEERRAAAAELGPITVDEQGHAVGGALLAVETAQSSVEPRLGGYDDEALREAFAADEGCEHVIQPF